MRLERRVNLSIEAVVILRGISVRRLEKRADHIYKLENDPTLVMFWRPFQWYVHVLTNGCWSRWSIHSGKHHSVKRSIGTRYVAKVLMPQTSLYNLIKLRCEICAPENFRGSLVKRRSTSSLTFDAQGTLPYLALGEAGEAD